MEVNNKSSFKKFKKFIVVEPEYLESLKKVHSYSAEVDENDVNLLKTLKNKNLNANQKLNMFREILLTNKVPAPKATSSSKTLNRDGNETASSFGSDNVFEASFSQLLNKVEKMSPATASQRPFDGVDISVDMSEAERKKLQDYLNSQKSDSATTAVEKSLESERYEPYTVPARALRSSWTKYEDMIAEEETREFATKTLTKQKPPKSYTKNKNKSK